MKKICYFIFINVLLFMNSCEDAVIVPADEYDATVKNTETYRYDFNISGDEEGARIIEQAKHFEISELKRDEATNWSVVYYYKPETGYNGADSVKIETNTGSDGASEGIKDTVKMVFFVTN